jgi:SAM-dependent methyltransferase
MSARPVLVSILIPLYNEEEFITELLSRVLKAPLPEAVSRELIVVDDASRDTSAEQVTSMIEKHPGFIRLVRHEVNQGKGAAIRTAIEHARGEFSIIQDADLEYDPSEYSKLLAPLIEDRADAVYGSRFLSAGERRVLYYWHSLGNKLLTMLCNMVADINLTDMETCYKAFRTSLVRSIPLRSNRFGIEPELTIKLAQRGVRIYETPISYHGRTYEEGKKIGLKDAFQALGTILRFGFTRDIYRESGPEILDVLANAPAFNRWMADTIRPYVGTRVLELGAGIGNLTAQLSPKRACYFGTDIDQEHLARLRGRMQHRPNVSILKCDLENPADFQPFLGSLDTVICLNVLEHVADDRLGLRNVCSALQPGGQALILVPEGMSVYGTLDKVLGHHRRYSESELRSKLEETGFEVLTVLKFNRITRPAWFINGRVLKKRTFSRFQISVFDHLVWLWLRLDRFLPWAPTSLIAVGTKAHKAN